MERSDRGRWPDASRSPTRNLQQDTVRSIPSSAHAKTAILAGGCFWPVSFAAAPVAADVAVLVCAALVYHRFSGHSYPHRPVHITSASGSGSGPASATAAGGERATPVSPLQPHLTDADLQAVVNETHEVYDIDADDLRDLLKRLEARIGARCGLGRALGHAARGGTVNRANRRA